MQYNSIISVISKYLKYKLAEDQTTIMKGSLPTYRLSYYFETIIPDEKCTKIIYDSLNIANSYFNFKVEHCISSS